MTCRARYAAVLSLLFVTACSRPPSITSEPHLVMNPGGRTPLAGVLSFTTDQPVRVTLVISDGENRNSITPRDSYATEHELMVLGLRPGRSHTIEVGYVNERGEAGQPALLDYDTAPLPDFVPPIDVVLSRPGRMEPGVTLVALNRSIDNEPDRDFGLIVALDAQGEVVWLYEAPHRLDEPRRLPNGNILHRGVRTQMFEIDMLGRRVNHWAATAVRKDAPPTAITVDTDSIHHDVMLMPSGNFLALSTEVRHVDSYPTDVDDPESEYAPANVVGDVLVEFRPDGRIVREFRLLDLLPTRAGYGATNDGFYKEVYGDAFEELPFDWSHSNGIAYDAADDAAIVSSNHLSAVFKIDLGEGKIDWILGPPDGWEDEWQALRLQPVADMQWFWHQHAPELTPDGTLLIYDNGTHRAFPPDPKIAPPEAYSRAVEYRIDEANRTVEEIWSYGGPGEEWFFSGYVSEADRLPRTGNVLITNGGRVRRPEGGPGVYAADGRVWVSIAEVTRTEPAEKVWEVVIDDPGTSWQTFRSERWPGLYPQVP